jgi:hypothetical protein
LQSRRITLVIIIIIKIKKTVTHFNFKGKAFYYVRELDIKCVSYFDCGNVMSGQINVGSRVSLSLYGYSWYRVTDGIRTVKTEKYLKDFQLEMDLFLQN